MGTDPYDADMMMMELLTAMSLEGADPTLSIPMARAIGWLVLVCRQLHPLTLIQQYSPL